MSIKTKITIMLLFLASGVVPLPADAATPPPFRVRTLLGGEYWWTAPDAAYLDYLAQVKPDLIHGAVLGPELASGIYAPGTLKAITPLCPAEARTMREYLAWWQDYVTRVHRHGIKVQATFSLVNVWGDQEQQTGWFKYYNQLWETDLLGSKPAEKPEALMEFENGALGRNDGQAGWYRYRGCINNPQWRALLKIFVRTGIEAGFDGFMVQFAHARGPCTCPYCQTKFRGFLKERFSARELAERFKITDLDQHVFTSTGARSGMPEPIDLAAREFTEFCVADCFDEVFLQYGRSLKPDLLVSKWFHFRQFLSEDTTNTRFAAYMDERALIPADRWSTGEDYVWYSSPVYKSDLKNGIAGDSALDGRYLRAMCGATPFEVLKYDYWRWRVTVVESLALGGIAFGAWKGGWSGGADREEPHLKTYFEFIRDNDRYLSGRDSHAEVGLLYPRSAFRTGDAAFFEPVRRLGRALVTGHVLFDFLIDQKLTLEDLARHRVVVIPAPHYLSASHLQMLNAYVAAGGKVFTLPSEQTTEWPAGWTVYRGDLKDQEAIVAALSEAVGGGFSTFAVPWMVEVYADRQPQEHRLLVHLVNFNRTEQDGKELPIAAAPARIDLRLPVGFKAKRVIFLTPEAKPQKLKFSSTKERLQFTTPAWLVYGLCVIEGR